MLNGRLWLRHLRIGNHILITLLLNETFTRVDGYFGHRINVYRDHDADIPIRVYQLRVGHYWLSLDIF